MIPRNHEKSLTIMTRIQYHPASKSQPISRISCHGCWTIPGRVRYIIQLIKISAGVAQNTAPENFNGYGTRQTIMASGPTPHQAREESPIWAKKL